MDINEISDGEWFLLLEVADQLDATADSGQDCLSTLCTLSGAGNWTVIDGQDIYSALCDDEIRQHVAERDGVLIETHTPGDGTIPTRVAMRFGLDETNVCKNAGSTLQGEDFVERPIFQLHQKSPGETTLIPTTLREILSKDRDGDLWWTPVKWSQIQTIVDASGGQSERFKLVALILRLLGEARMDEVTFIPFGFQFSDTDFIG